MLCLFEPTSWFQCYRLECPRIGRKTCQTAPMRANRTAVPPQKGAKYACKNRASPRSCGKSTKQVVRHPGKFYPVETNVGMPKNSTNPPRIMSFLQCVHNPQKLLPFAFCVHKLEQHLKTNPNACRTVFHLRPIRRLRCHRAIGLAKLKFVASGCL